MSADEGTAVPPSEVDPGDGFDSALGDSEGSTTQSIRSSLLDSTKENGRGYHKYRDGQYLLPEDAGEQDRLDMQHHMYLLSLQNQLYRAPIKHPIKEVLDLGTGTGLWAIDFADQHPETNVLGVDLSPIQPSWVPPNCQFEIDDYDEEWLYKNRFDFIHGRMMLTSSADFKKLFQQAYDNLQPGGWFEIQDASLPLGCEDGTMKGTALDEWSQLFMEATTKIGRDPSSAMKYEGWMIEAGFEEVVEYKFKWPCNTWPRDKQLKELGKWNMINMLDGLEGFTVRLFTKALEMSLDEVQVRLAAVRRDISNRRIHSYWPMFATYGRKPFDAT